jgi:DNA-binding transcriptional ArsR family regulator
MVNYIPISALTHKPRKTMTRPPESEIRELHAQFCQALADPTRIMLLYTLAEGPRNVGELATKLKLSQPNVSRHLKVLRERGMAVATREGANVVYSLDDKRVLKALDLMREVLGDQLARRAQLAEAL